MEAYLEQLRYRLHAVDSNDVKHVVIADAALDDSDDTDGLESDGEHLRLSDPALFISPKLDSQLPR